MGQSAVLEEPVDLDPAEIQMMDARLELFLAYVKHNLPEDKRLQLETSYDFIDREGVGKVYQVTLGFKDDPPGCEKGFINIGTKLVSEKELNVIIRQRGWEMADFLMSLPPGS